MKHLTLLVPAGHNNNLSSLVGTYKLFLKANEHWQGRHSTQMFQVQLAGISDNVDFFDGLFSVKPHTHIQAITHTDLIIIPSLNHNYPHALQENAMLADWIAKQYKLGAEVASICTGAFLLAETGLLDGKTCSTHWSAADTFKTMFPKVHVQTDKLITSENGLYTNGGAFSFLNFIVYLIEKYYDRQTAIYCSKVFQIEMDRNSQSTFSIFTGQKQHTDELVQQAQQFIESHVASKVSVEDLSEKFALSRRNFDRRFIKATGNTPLEYAQRVKIEAAKRSLENSRKTVNEVMYEVGYSDVKAFREVFRKVTGISPVAYRNKYRWEGRG